MSVGILMGGLLIGTTLLLAGGGKKKKAPPSPEQIAEALAEAEARGEVVVTDDGDVIEVEPDDETNAIAEELAEAEERGEVVVTDDGDVAEQIAPDTWQLPANWFALFEVKPTGDSDALMQVLRSGSVSGDIYIIGGPTKSGNVKFASFDQEPSVFVQGEQLTPDIPATLVNIDLLSKAEFDKLVMTDKRDPIAAELEEAEAAGEIKVTEKGEVVPVGNASQAAAALEEAEARGEVVVTDDGDIIEVDPETEEDVAVMGPDPAAQALAELLIAAERERGGLWKAALQAEVQAWQLEQGVDYQGRALKPDGKFGKVGALTLASLGVDAIPLVRFWPSGANQQTAVTEYKIALQGLQTADPEAVRVALLRERGQGFGAARAISPAEQVG